MDPELEAYMYALLGHFSAIIMHVYVLCFHTPFKMTASPLIYMDVVHTFVAVCRHMYINYVNLIVTQQIGKTPLHDAAMSGDAEVVNAPLKARSKVDEKDKVSMF